MADRTVILLVSLASGKRAPAWAAAEKAIKAWTPKQLKKHAWTYFETYYTKNEGATDADGDENNLKSARYTEVNPTDADARASLIEDLRTLKAWWSGRSPANTKDFYIAGYPVFMAEVLTRDENGEGWELLYRLKWPLEGPLSKVVGLDYEEI